MWAPSSQCLAVVTASLAWRSCLVSCAEPFFHAWLGEAKSTWMTSGPCEMHKGKTALLTPQQEVFQRFRLVFLLWRSVLLCCPHGVVCPDHNFQSFWRWSWGIPASLGDAKVTFLFLLRARRFALHSRSKIWGYLQTIFLVWFILVVLVFFLCRSQVPGEVGSLSAWRKVPAEPDGRWTLGIRFRSHSFPPLCPPASSSWTMATKLREMCWRSRFVGRCRDHRFLRPFRNHMFVFWVIKCSRSFCLDFRGTKCSCQADNVPHWHCRWDPVEISNGAWVGVCGGSKDEAGEVTLVHRASDVPC